MIKPPKTPKPLRRVAYVKVRVTETEHERLTRAAIAAGLPVSSWIRQLALKVAT